MNKSPEREPNEGRNFKDVIENLPDGKNFDTDRRDAMEIGDFILVHPNDFKAWAGDIVESSNEPFPEQPPLKVSIVEFEDVGEYPRLKMVVEAAGIKKRIYSSLFYNRFTNHSKDLTYYSSEGGLSGFEQDPGHIVPGKGDIIQW